MLIFLQGGFLDGQYHGLGTLVLKKAQIVYKQCMFYKGEPSPRPTHIVLDYPKVVDKKKGELPPELLLGQKTATEFQINISIQGHKARTDASSSDDQGAADDLDSEAADAMVECTNETQRLLTVHVCKGWPTDSTPLERIDDPCLGVELCIAEDSELLGTDLAGADAQSDGAATAVAKLHTANGSAMLSDFTFGKLDSTGSPTLTPGQYTLVFESAGVESAMVPVMGIAAKK